jgi:hypothetical protein
MIMDDLISGETAQGGGRDGTQPPATCEAQFKNTLPTQRKENARQSDIASNYRAQSAKTFTSDFRTLCDTNHSAFAL